MALIVGGAPILGQQFVEAVLGDVGDASEDVGEPGLRIDVGFRDTLEPGARLLDYPHCSSSRRRSCALMPARRFSPRSPEPWLRSVAQIRA